MKALFTFIGPALKAMITVIGLIIGLGWGAFQAVEAIAKAQGEVVESKVMAVRAADMGHLDKRFDDTHAILKEIKEDLKDIKRMR